MLFLIYTRHLWYWKKKGNSIKFPQQITNVRQCLEKTFQRTQQDGLVESSRGRVWDVMKSAAKCIGITFAVARVLCRPWEVCAANPCWNYRGRRLSLGYATTGFSAVREDRGSKSLQVIMNHALRCNEPGNHVSYLINIYSSSLAKH